MLSNGKETHITLELDTVEIEHRDEKPTKEQMDLFEERKQIRIKRFT